MDKPELLAPAGDFERFKAAVDFGADAVYLGAKMFTMRAAPSNFDKDELPQSVEYAHSKGVKVHLTCNTLPTNQEADQIEDFLYYARDCKVDALIVADVGILMTAKKIVPQIDVHVSTQAGVVNYLTATNLYELGAKRVVLARELSIEDIATIRAKTPKELELEAFVHGAMCVSFSGRCLLSNYFVSRDANRGECAQPCRWGYYLMEEKRPGQYYPIFEDEKGSYILNARDLCMIEYIDQIVKAGVTSLKIEGRAKSAYYVSVVTNAYRCAIDAFLKDPDHYKAPDWVVDEVKKVSHRDYSTGFYFGRPADGQYYKNGGYIRDWDVIAIVDDYKDGYLYCTEKNKFYKGDTVEILQPFSAPFSMTIEQIIDETGKDLSEAKHANMKIRIPSQHAFQPGSIIRKRKD